MERYPDALPPPVLRVGAWSEPENMVLDEMAGGNFKSRNRWPAEDLPMVKEFTWRLRKAEAAFFEGWWRHVLGARSTPFEMKISTPAAPLPTVHECVFLSSPMAKREQISGLLWQYSARVAIKRLLTLSEAETMAEYFEPFDLSDLVARMGAATSVYVE